MMNIAVDSTIARLSKGGYFEIILEIGVGRWGTYQAPLPMTGQIRESIKEKQKRIIIQSSN